MAVNLPIADKATLDNINTLIGVGNPETAGTDTVFKYLKGISNIISQQSPQFVKASDTVRVSAPTERTNSNINDKVVVKKFIVGVTGAVRLKFQLSATSTSTYYAFAYFYLNNVEYGKLSTSSTSYVSLSQDIEGVKPGDIIKIAIQPNTSGVTANIKNVTVCYDTYTLTTSGSVELD